MRREEAIKKLRLLAVKESESKPKSPIHAVQAITFVLTIPVRDARLARSVAIRWHRARQGMQKTGTASADGAGAEGQGLTTQPGTSTYHARVARDRGIVGIDVRGSKAGSSAGRRARTTEGHGLVNAPPSEQAPIVSSLTGTTVRRRARRRRVRVSVEAQLMANCPVIRYDAAEYDAGPPVKRFLQWSGARLAAGILWVSGICGPAS